MVLSPLTRETSSFLISSHCVYTYVGDTGSWDSITEEVLFGFVWVTIFFIAVHPHSEAWISGQFSVYFICSRSVGSDRFYVPSIIASSLEINFLDVFMSADETRYEVIVDVQFYFVTFTFILVAFQLCSIFHVVVQNDLQFWIFAPATLLTCTIKNARHRYNLYVSDVIYGERICKSSFVA